MRFLFAVLLGQFLVVYHFLPSLFASSMKQERFNSLNKSTAKEAHLFLGHNEQQLRRKRSYYSDVSSHHDSYGPFDSGSSENSYSSEGDDDDYYGGNVYGYEKGREEHEQYEANSNRGPYYVPPSVPVKETTTTAPLTTSVSVTSAPTPALTSSTLPSTTTIPTETTGESSTFTSPASSSTPVPTTIETPTPSLPTESSSTLSLPPTPTTETVTTIVPETSPTSVSMTTVQTTPPITPTPTPPTITPVSTLSPTPTIEVQTSPSTTPTIEVQTSPTTSITIPSTSISTTSVGVSTSTPLPSTHKPTHKTIRTTHSTPTPTTTALAVSSTPEPITLPGTTDSSLLGVVTTCTANFQQEPCKPDGKCPVTNLGKWCCCGSETTATKLNSTEGRCETSDCNAVLVVCDGCRPRGPNGQFCACKMVRSSSV